MDDGSMDKVTQALFQAEFRKFVLRDSAALEGLDAALLDQFKVHHTRLDVPAIQRRARALRELPDAPHPDTHYLATFGVRGVVRYPLSSGQVIYKIPVFSFPMNAFKDHWTATYLVLGSGAATLVDTGTHLSEASLREGFRVVREFYGEPISLEQLDHIVITHAHFDHFGGLAFALPAGSAGLYIHEWDAPTLVNYRDEVARGRQRIGAFLRQSGAPEEEIEAFLRMHGDPKRDVAGFPVRGAFGDGERLLDTFEVIHTPGHCPGLACLRVGDVMLLGDHVLNGVTPHQFPKIYTAGSGLKNYLNSLVKIAAHSETVRLGLPSHYGDVLDIEGRVREIVAEHHQRIVDLMKDLDRPRSLHQITHDYFRFRRGRDLSGYERMLALEEIAAHLEYMQETLGIVRQVPTNGGGDAMREEPVHLYERVA
jgi:glyoxylase-like metal-dependent hydrolase (beta-lactamase superfamily II)